MKSQQENQRLAKKVVETDEHAERWRQAIADAGQLYAESDDKAERCRLLGAIDCFKYRLGTGAPYPWL
jgi:hypothetical protein